MLVTTQAGVGYPTPESVFERLAALDEADLRRILRTHRDVPFRGDQKYDQEALALRSALQVALDRLTVDELRLQTGSNSVQPPVRQSLLALLASSAFARFVNSYLYFGVRFMAARLLGPDAFVQPHSLALPYPPALSPDVPRVIGVDERRRVREDPDVAEALAFLDDGVPSDRRVSHEDLTRVAQTDLPMTSSGDENAGWHADYERWLYGLGHHPDRAEFFRRITRGLRTFIREQVSFYTDLEGHWQIDSQRVNGRLDDVVTLNPHTARCGLLDVYWQARLLRADVSANGIVAYTGRSWLELLAERARMDGEESSEWHEAASLLRGVLEYTCDVVQNAVAIRKDFVARARTPEAFPARPAETVGWAQAYDEELVEISLERRRRGFFGATLGNFPPEPNPARHTWTQRTRTGEHLGDLVGLALSGGGLRSATFNLGVLQRLQEVDLLRTIDYVSAVTGGSYIGAWLVGNVQRTNQWVSQQTDWSASIDYLRRQTSNLTPPKGLLRVDTWTKWMGWIRSAVLVQMTAVMWLWALLVVARINEFVFTWPKFSVLAAHPGNLLLVPSAIIVTAAIVVSIRHEATHARERHVLALAVMPAWIGSFMTAAILWANRPLSQPTYTVLVSTTWREWTWPLLCGVACASVLAAVSIDRQRSRVVAFGYGAAASACAMAVLYLGLCGIRFLFSGWSGAVMPAPWFPYLVGPSLVMFLLVVAVQILVGLLGDALDTTRREWWSRFAAWLLVIAVGFFCLSAASLLGPFIGMQMLGAFGDITVVTVVGWIGAIAGVLLNTVLGSLFGGEAGGLNRRLIDGARVIALPLYVGILGLLMVTGLHVLLNGIFTDVPISAASYWLQLASIRDVDYWLALTIIVGVGLILSLRFSANLVGLSEFQRNRLVQCYLGATRWRPGERSPSLFSGFDDGDDLPLASLRHSVKDETRSEGPFPILGSAVKLGGSSLLGARTREVASFAFTPLRAGAEHDSIGYAPTSVGSGYAGGLSLGQAVAVSGSIADFGERRSSRFPSLASGVFTGRPPSLVPNPGGRFWHLRSSAAGVWYFVKSMFNLTDETGGYLALSDGSAFDSLGLYELVRRRCRVIICSDATSDPELAFANLANAIRLCETDFDVRIAIDVADIGKQKDSGRSERHWALGRINYSNGSRGHLIYLKASITGDEEVTIEEYAAAHPGFPHESSIDRVFEEPQFETYRRLGYHIAYTTFRDVEREPTLARMAAHLSVHWIPTGTDAHVFTEQSKALSALWERFSTSESDSTRTLLAELLADRPSPTPAHVSEEQLTPCLEVLQLMETVFIELRLSDFSNHPNNRGWMALFTMWTKSGTFRAAWLRTRHTFTVGFVDFCERRFGL